MSFKLGDSVILPGGKLSKIDAFAIASVTHGRAEYLALCGGKSFDVGVIELAPEPEEISIEADPEPIAQPPAQSAK